jgi:hypothetical protein
MAMIRCGECGKDVSDKASACVNCGAPIQGDIVERALGENPQTCPFCKSLLHRDATDCQCGAQYGYYGGGDPRGAVKISAALIAGSVIALVIVQFIYGEWVAINALFLVLIVFGAIALFKNGIAALGGKQWRKLNL